MKKKQRLTKKLTLSREALGRLDNLPQDKVIGGLTVGGSACAGCSGGFSCDSCTGNVCCPP